MTDKDWDIATLENSYMQLSIVPAMGGKITSLYDKRNKVQYLHQPSSTLNKVKMPHYGDTFEPPFAFGFDECFPTIEPCAYPCEKGNIELPDHGELWSSSWEYKIEQNSIHLYMQGKKLNYDFYRNIRLIKNEVEITYAVTNNEPFPFEYIWSAHPLLNISPGDKVILSNDITELKLYWASDSDFELNHLWSKVPWPSLYDTNEKIDFSVVPDSSKQFAVKLFTGKLQDGQAEFHKPKSNAKLVFNFDTEEIPYLGIWLCYGGWPNQKDGDITLALEPCSGRPDSLQKACEIGEASKLSPCQTHKWEMRMEIETITSH